MLNMIIGPAKSGKTTRVREEIKTAAKNGEQIFLIVPEQYTFETEKQLYLSLDASLMQQVCVTSFTRVCSLIFKTYGGCAGTYSDEAAQTVLMAQTVATLHDRLSVYEKSARNDSFVHTMCETVTLLKNAGIDADTLKMRAQQITDERLRQKLFETAELYAVYDALLQEQYADPLDDLSRAVKLLKTHPFFENSVVFFDEFKGFTGVERQFLSCVIAQAKETTFTFCEDEMRAGDDSVFSPVHTERMRVVRMAREAGIAVHTPVRLTDTHYASEAIAQIERMLFSETVEPLSHDTGEVTIMMCEDRYEEAEYAAAEIHRLVREGHLRWRDIAVISRDASPYADPIEMAFSKLSIPYFSDQTVSAADHAIIRFLIGVIECAAYGVNAKRLNVLLKSELCGVDQMDAGIFENYTFVWDIQPDEWAQPFFANPSGFKESMSEQEAETLARAESVRKRLVEPLLSFIDATAETDARTFCEEVFKLFCTLGIRESMEARVQRFYDADDYAQAKEEQTMYESVLHLLDTIVLIVGQKPLSPKRFCTLLSLASRSFSHGVLPQTIDSVTVTAADRFRFGDKKVVFILGATQKELPRLPTNGTIFSSRECELMASVSLELSKSDEEMMLEERLLAYRALTAPSGRLYLLAPCRGADDASREPSALLQMVSQIACTPVQSSASLPVLFWCENAQTAWSTLARRYWRDTPETASLRKVLSELPETMPLIDSMDRILSDQGFHLTSAEQAKKLFGRRMFLSPTQIESFYRCPFRYFLEYGLHVRPLRRASLDPLESGSMIHRLLYELTQTLDFQAEYDEQMMRAAADEAINRYMESVMGGRFAKSKRFLYLCRKLRETVLRLLSHLHMQFAEGGFLPCAYEYEIADGQEVPPLTLYTADNTCVRVAGKIDRIDRYYSKNGRQYIRVVDYKSGNKQFNLNDVLAGLNLQMLFYLHCIVKNGTGQFENALPAGVLYLHAADPASDHGHSDPIEKIEQERKKSYRMNGLLLNDLEVLDAMDHGFSGVFIPVSCKKDGTFTADSVRSLASLKDLGHIGNYLEKLVRNMATELHHGQIAADPIEQSCDFCRYRSVCGRSEQKQARCIVKQSNEAIIKEMEAYDGGDSNDQKSADGR